MEKLEFVGNGINRYDVRVVSTKNKYDWQKCGELRFDKNQDAWVFDYGEDGVTYEESLEETKQELQNEFEDGKHDRNAIIFGNGNYRY